MVKHEGSKGSKVKNVNVIYQQNEKTQRKSNKGGFQGTIKSRTKRGQTSRLP
jgi:phage FluMu protein Com